MKFKTWAFWMFKRSPSGAYMLLDHSTESNLFRCKHDEFINPHMLNDLQRTKPTLLVLMQLKAEKRKKKKNTHPLGQTIVNKFYCLESALKAVLGEIYFIT